jgi:hypothetical protein
MQTPTATAGLSVAACVVLATNERRSIVHY